MDSFASRFRQLREAKRLTQDELAEKLGVSRSAVAGYESEEKNRTPRPEVLNKAAELFEVTADYLLFGKTNNIEEFRYPSQQKTEWIIREMVEKYHWDLTEEGMKEKLESIIKLVAGDQKAQN